MKTKLLIILMLSTFTMAFVSAPQSNPYVFSGTGDDVITTEIIVSDFPIMQLSSVCENDFDYISITLFGHNDEEISVFYDYCNKQGIIYYANNEIKQIDFIQVSGAKDWILSFLPLSEGLVPVYHAPATIEGTGTTFFSIENPGKVLAFDYPSADYFEVYQYSSEGIQGWDGNKQLFYEQGPYFGKTIINPKFTFFQIFASGKWKFEIIGSGSTKPADNQNMEPEPEVVSTVEAVPPEVIVPTEIPIPTEILPVETEVVAAENGSPDYLKLYANRSTFPEYDNQMQLAASSFGLLGGKYINNWELFTYIGDFSLEELANNVYAFYQSEYADDGFLPFAEPKLFPLILMEEDLGEGYQMLLQRGTERIWIVVSRSYDKEKGVFVFYCSSAAG